MAKRPVYIAKTNGTDFVEELEFEFQWYPGFAVVQKQKSIWSLHEAYKETYPEKKILEVSSKSEDSLGVKLSAFNLVIKGKNNEFSVECAFQSSKLFERGGPYREILGMTSREAKKYDKLKESGDVVAFDFFGMRWETEPKTLFYDWIYINAIHQNRELAEKLVEYDAFTDIEFNPKKSFNSQCRAAALYVSLYKRGQLEEIFDQPNRAKRIEKYKAIISQVKEVRFVEKQMRIEGDKWV